MMNPIVVVRRYEAKDAHQTNEIIRNYVMSKFSAAFWFCCFREITLQLIVLATAIFFIFFGVPLLYCISSVPIVVILIAVIVYCAHYNKAIELSNLNPPICFVADLYEPFTIAIRVNKKELEYIILSENELQQYEQELKKMRGKRVVGTVSIRNHHSLHESAWIHRLAIDTNYSFNQIARPLIVAAMEHAYANHMFSVESVTAECHEDARELFLKIGFNIRQIYHKSIIGSSLRIMKAQMGIDLKRYFKHNKTKGDLNEASDK